MHACNANDANAHPSRQINAELLFTKIRTEKPCIPTIIGITPPKLSQSGSIGL